VLYTTYNLSQKSLHFIITDNSTRQISEYIPIEQFTPLFLRKRISTAPFSNF